MRQSFPRQRALWDITQFIGASLDLILANPAGKRLQLKGVAKFRVRRAPAQTHGIFAIRAGRSIGYAKTNSHAVFLFAKGPSCHLN
jgi:hypothetical protein